MTLTSRLLAHFAELPPALGHAVDVEHDLQIPMADGVQLLADRYFPRGSAKAPVVLIRTPYGRREFGLFGRIFAERGVHAVVQSVRGTFGSGGNFNPFFDEERDGRATVDWVGHQTWFDSSLGMYGPSYLGFVQWAVAAGAPSYLKALAIQIATPNRHATLYDGGAFNLNLALTISQTFALQERPLWRRLLSRRSDLRALERAVAHLPLAEADQLAAGHPIPCYQDWLNRNEQSDRHWAAIDYSQRLAATQAHVNLLGGWYDCYLPATIDAYRVLRDAGGEPHLTIGPWAHTSFGAMAAGLRESLAWFDSELLGASARRASPVRIFVMGSKRWLDLPDWPPPARPTRWHLQSGFGLECVTPSPSAPDGYEYDPANPTPALGGSLLGEGGAKDNRKLEARADVLAYTSQPLAGELEIIGEVKADLYVRSSLQHADFFVRLCDVDPRGRSINLCDGFVRLTPQNSATTGAQVHHLRIQLWPTAHCFRPGHRIRLQISSGAHPRYSRNLGTGEPLGTATLLRTAHQEVHHDPQHPSSIELPVH